MSYGMKVAIAIDQLLAVVLFGAMPDETISAMAHRRQWKQLEKMINLIFCDDMHCAKAYISELVGSQNAKEYRHEAD